MTGGALTIGRWMIVIAIAGVSMALIQALPTEALTIPSFWVVMGVLDFVSVWKLVLQRPLRAAHHVYLIVFVIGYFVLANQVAMERIDPMGLLIRCYQQLAQGPQPSAMLLRDIAGIGNFWLAAAITMFIGAFAGAFAGWLERSRGWDIAAVCRGLLIGLGIASLLGVIQHAILGPEKESILMNRILLLGACPLSVWLGKSRLRSSDLTDPRNRLARTEDASVAQP